MKDQGTKDCGLPQDDYELPSWFVDARSSASGRYGHVEHDGCRIAYQAWGNDRLPPMLMLHGNGASSEWWEATAILLADRYHIVAPSFSGVGRSGWRESYRIEQSVKEAMACAFAELGSAAEENVIVVAHSFGSETGVRLAADPARRIAHLVMVDSLIDLPSPRAFSTRTRERKYYPSIEDAAHRFSTLPRDDFGPPFLRLHVARQSLERLSGPGGELAWSWRADPNCLARMEWESAFSLLGEALCPVDFIYGECSSMNSPELRARQARAVGGEAEFRELKGAGHHIPLDCPQELAAAILDLIALRREQ